MQALDRMKTASTVPDIGAAGQDVGTQYAALCWRRLNDKTQVLLITSRDTGRWIIPKGWPMKNRAPQEAAMQEAFEEAGVEGKVDAACLGVYSYFKVQGAEDIRPCVVAVYPVKTRRLLNKYPEEGQRRRKWFSPKKAAQKVLEPQLRELLMQFDPDGIGKAAESDRGLDALKAKTANRPAGTPPTPARGKPGKSARRGR